MDNEVLNPNYDENLEDHNLLTAMIVHTNDLYVPTKSCKLAIKWSRLVNAEFINQNVEEVKRTLPITPYYTNLEKTLVMAKSESFFIAKIVTPLWKSMDRFLKGSLNH